MIFGGITLGTLICFCISCASIKLGLRPDGISIDPAFFASGNDFEAEL